MTTAVVLVLLLDNWPGFNRAINDTIAKDIFLSGSNTTIDRCDPIVEDTILKIRGVQTLNKNFNDFSKKDPIKSILYGIYNDRDDSKNVVVFKSEHKVKQELVNRLKLYDSFKTFPADHNYLVAIFETIGNLTAQTCAGSIVAPSWVLTSASCVNLFRSLNTTLFNTSDPAHFYTIVANSSNPLRDGSVHNVTEVLVHPDELTRENMLGEKDLPIIALMRISPAINLKVLPILREHVREDVDVQTYGWITKRNETNKDELRAITISAKMSGCENKNVSTDAGALCLYTSDDQHIKNQINSGGPVVVMHHRVVTLAAILQADQNSTLTPYPVSRYWDWIHQTILQ